MFQPTVITLRVVVRVVRLGQRRCFGTKFLHRDRETDWVILINGDGDADGSSRLAADSQTKSDGMV